jgi:uncharacterized protein YacL
MLKKHMVRGAMGAMLIDQYDGFVIMTAIPGICENIRGILIRKEKWRKEVLALQTGGSIIGLVIAIIMVALPILAHHGLVPQSKLRQMLHDMPVVLFKISQRMKQGEQAMNEMMERVAAEALKPEKPKEGDGNNTVPPTNVYPFAPTGTAP